MDLFKLPVEIMDPPLQLPQINDKWTMQILKVENYGTEELMQLSRVSCYKKVILLSNIIDASGRAIDEKYLRPQPLMKVG
jgi:hypothetical protein